MDTRERLKAYRQINEEEQKAFLAAHGDDERFIEIVELGDTLMEEFREHLLLNNMEW